MKSIIRNRKRWAVFLLSAAIATLSACSRSMGEQNWSDENPVAALESMDGKDEPHGAPVSSEERDSDLGDAEAETAKQYYAYLKEVTTGKQDSLVPEEPWRETMTLNRHEMYGFDAWKSGYTGLVSAFLEDFDSDGTLEMMCVFLRYDSIYNTVYRDVFFDPGSALDSETSEYTCMYLQCSVYDMNEAGEIESRGGYEWAIMPTDSWGRLLIGIEKMEDTYYLFGYSESENMSTYGPRHFVVGELGSYAPHWGYSSVFNWGRADAGNYKGLLHVGSLNISGTTLETLEITPDGLGGRLVAMADFEHISEKLNGGLWKDTIVITVTDCTDLRKHLESGGSTWERIQLPQGGTVELPKNDSAENRFSEITAQINQATGTEFELQKTSENEGIIWYSYLSKHGTELGLSWNTERQSLESVGVYSVGSQADDEWNAVKDVLVGLPEFGFSLEEAEPFMGEIKDWLTYVNGVEVGGYEISVYEIINAGFRVRRLAP